MIEEACEDFCLFCLVNVFLSFRKKRLFPLALSHNPPQAKALQSSCPILTHLALALTFSECSFIYLTKSQRSQRRHFKVRTVELEKANIENIDARSLTHH